MIEMKKTILISEQSNGKYQIYLNTNLCTIFDVPEQIIKTFVDQVWTNTDKNGRYIKHYKNKEDL